VVHYQLRPVGTFGVPQQISTGFACWLHYCSDVAQWRPTKLCTIFDHLQDWCTIYTFSEALARWQNFARCKIHFASKFCVLLYWYRHYTALQHGHQTNSAVLRRGCHLYSAGWPSRWASAHILVFYIFTPALTWLSDKKSIWPVNVQPQQLSKFPMKDILDLHLV